MKTIVSNETKLIVTYSGLKYKNVSAQIGKVKLRKRFDEYIAYWCNKAEDKLSVLMRLSNFMCTNEKITFMKEPIKMQLVIAL